MIGLEIEYGESYLLEIPAGTDIHTRYLFPKRFTLFLVTVILFWAS